MLCSRILLISISFASSLALGATGSFLKGDDRYRGFYWFEEKNQTETAEKSKKQQFVPPTAKEAKASIKARKKQLDDARNIMLELSYRDDVPAEELRAAIAKYRKLEIKLIDSSMHLAQESAMTNFLDPSLANLRENPTNSFANRLKRQQEEINKTADINEFAKEFDLILFASDRCPYSKAFVPVAKDFAKDHRFNLEISALDSKEGEVAKRLGIKATPTLVAMKKDASLLFELLSGFATIPELEAAVLLGKAYTKEQNSKHQKRSK